MPDLSEFIAFIAEKSGIKNLSLVEKDIILHKILREFPRKNYLFKGGSCLVKCYIGYYRFSVDLDFTWKDQGVWEGLGKKMLRKRLLEEIRNLASSLKEISEHVALEFEADLGNRRFIEFGGGGRMATFKLWKGLELVKIQANFIEKLLFPPKSIIAKTLLSGAKLSKDEEAYFEEFLDFYKPLQVEAYDEREIFCEKVRAILTRRAQKLRDFYDLYILSKRGLKIEDLKEEIIRKTRAALHYKKYRENLERNRELEVGREVLDDPFERGLFVIEPEVEFEDFLKKFVKELREIAITV
ncbi:MAG: nucleotidyl transferase AbiEii/AbiGii toxin family protein [Candidatus Asgardarchaeia archaeon]